MDFDFSGFFDNLFGSGSNTSTIPKYDEDIYGYNLGSLNSPPVDAAETTYNNATPFLDSISNPTITDAAYEMTKVPAFFGDSAGMFSSLSDSLNSSPSTFSNILDTIGNGAKAIGSYTLDNPKTALTAGTLGLQAISAMNKAKTAKDYINSRREGITEANNAADSSFRQNQAAQRTALAKKLGTIYSDAGGTNMRNRLNDMKRSQNAGYADFLLGKAQQNAKLADPGYQTYADQDWFTGFSQGGANTLASLLSNQLSSEQLSNLFKKKGA